MTQKNHVIPKFGGRSILVLFLWFVGLSALYQDFAMIAEQPVGHTAEWAKKYSLLAGGVVGAACGGTWICSLIQNPFARWTTRISLVFLLAQFMNQLNYEGWIQNALDMSGIVVFQALFFFAFKVPVWENRFAKIDGSRPQPGRQFGIGDVVIATTLVAILLAIAMRRKTPISPDGYWVVLLSVWLIAGLTTTCFAKGMLTTDRRKSILLIVCGTLLAVGGTLSLATAESSFATTGASNHSFNAVYIPLYSRVVAVFSISVLLTAIAGRFQGTE